ncbi:MAG: cytidine deaminase [Kiritimatiellaeota bacterium]|nr:cytidine deaminase [Kiritimatiellota bacterium]
MTTNQQKNLIKKAVAAMRRAYAPYSRFCVGAALLTREGRIFQGCNVENASYGLTLCAERTALGAAVAAGHRRFTALAVASNGQSAPMPCGACLQALAEFCRPDFAIVTAAAQNPAAMVIYPLKDLLPRAFRLG